MSDQPVVSVIDDDRDSVDSLTFLLNEFGYATKGCVSPIKFFDEFEI